MGKMQYRLMATVWQVLIDQKPRTSVLGLPIPYDPFVPKSSPRICLKLLQSQEIADHAQQDQSQTFSRTSCCDLCRVLDAGQGLEVLVACPTFMRCLLLQQVSSIDNSCLIWNVSDSEFIEWYHLKTTPPIKLHVILQS